MRVLVYYRNRILESRGTPLRSRNLTAWLGRRPAVDVGLVSRDASGEVRRLLGVEHHPIEADGAGTAALERAVAELRPDVIYGQTHKGAYDLAGLAGTPRPRLVADLHGDPAWEKLEDRQRPLGRRLKGFLSSRLGERLLDRLDGFTAVSEALVERMRRRGKPARLLLGGVDTELFRAEPAAPAEGLTVGYAGSFRSYQGIDDLVTAVARLVARGEPVRLLLVGDLEGAPELRSRVERDLGGAATLLAPVDQARIPELLGGCDVLVVPRRAGRAAEHNYPSKMSEYLSLGRAVVVTDVGQAGRLADAAEVAVKVPAGDPEALAAAISGLSDPRRRARLAESARGYALEHLAWHRVAARLEAFLRRLVDPGRGSGSDRGKARRNNPCRSSRGPGNRGRRPAWASRRLRRRPPRHGDQVLAPHRPVLELHRVAVEKQESPP